MLQALFVVDITWHTLWLYFVLPHGWNIVAYEEWQEAAVEEQLM